MVLELKVFDVMEHLWDGLEKTHDGSQIRYTDMDVFNLWLMGFVDTARVTLNEWKEVFEPMRQPDGSFLLTKAQFFALDRYRYKGEIRIPFDAMLINEGSYTDEGLDELVEASIAPSCILEKDKLRSFIEEIKSEYRQPDGLILIKAPAKSKINELLEKYPSPLRNLELMLHRMLEAKGEDIHGAVEKAEINAVTAEAARQASSFSQTPMTQAEAKAKGLHALQKARRKPEPTAAADDGSPKTELKRIRRSRKGMRG